MADPADELQTVKRLLHLNQGGRRKGIHCARSIESDLNKGVQESNRVINGRSKKHSRQMLAETPSPPPYIPSPLKSNMHPYSRNHWPLIQALGQRPQQRPWLRA